MLLHVCFGWDWRQAEVFKENCMVLSRVFYWDVNCDFFMEYVVGKLIAISGGEKLNLYFGVYIVVCLCLSCFVAIDTKSYNV